MSLAILFHFLCAQHVSDINIFIIIISLRLVCWITTLVVLFLVRCVLEFRCGWVGVVSVLQAEAVLNMLRTLIYPSSGACNYSIELPHWSYWSWFDCIAVSVWLGWSGIRVASWSCAQHASDINISIISSLRLFCWITTLVYCSWNDVCWSFGVVWLEWYPCCRLIRSLRLFCWITTLVYCSWFDVGLEWYPCCRPATRIPLQPNHTETPTHIEPRTIDQCGNSTE